MGDHVPRSRVRSIVPIADVHARHGATDRVGRRSVAGDPSRPALARAATTTTPSRATAPPEGLAIARQIAQVTFRSDNVFTDRFGRELADRPAVGDTFGLWQQFEVERYLDYHGDKLVASVRRQQLPRDRQGDGSPRHRPLAGFGRDAMARITVPSLAIGISSDMLYPSYQQRQIHELLTRQGTPSWYAEVDSPHGHDAFLINVDQVSEPLGKFLGRVG